MQHDHNPFLFSSFLIIVPPFVQDFIFFRLKITKYSIQLLLVAAVDYCVTATLQKAMSNVNKMRNNVDDRSIFLVMTKRFKNNFLELLKITKRVTSD